MARGGTRLTMRLAFICYEYPPGPHGGVGRFTQVLGRELAARGHEVRALGVYPAPYPAADREVDQGVQVERIRDHGGRGSWVMARWQLYRRIRALARRREIDLVEAPDCYGWFAGWPRLPVPLVNRTHGTLTYFAHELGRPVAGMAARLERASYRRADAWVAVSAHAGRVTRTLFNLPRGPDATIYNPVPAPGGAPRGREPGLVVFTGTLTAKKGVIALADAWPRVMAAAPGSRLDLVGKVLGAPDGRPMDAFLLDRIPEPLRSTVRFRGHVTPDDVTSALRSAAVAVFPSYTETFGLGAAEAMSAGCPTIYTTRSCGPEIVRDGVDGLLADPDDPDALAATIVAVLRDPVLARRLGTAGAERARTAFEVSGIAQANEAFYSAVQERFGSRRAAA